jgi:hypothetical protein
MEPSSAHKDAFHSLYQYIHLHKDAKMQIAYYAIKGSVQA